MARTGPLPGAIVPQSRDWERTAFGPFTKRAIAGLAEAFFTDPDAPADRGAAARFQWVAADADAMIANCSAQMRLFMRLTAIALELLPIVFVGRLARCSSLPLDRRVRYLQRVEAGRLTQTAMLVVVWKTLLTILYFEHPEAAPRLGYDGRHERWTRIGKKPASAAPASAVSPAAEAAAP